MKRRTLNKIKAKHIWYGVDCYSVCEYKGIIFHIGKNARGYWYEDENRIICGTEYSSLSDVKADIKSELKELAEKEGVKL